MTAPEEGAEADPQRSTGCASDRPLHPAAPWPPWPPSWSWPPPAPPGLERQQVVVVGPGELLEADVVTAGVPVWTAGAAPGDRFECAVQLRAHGMTSPATVTVGGDEVRAALHVPQRGVAAGQALVMYDGETVLGSATITAARRSADVPA